jgi:selenocysteine-specific elongation factor
VGPGLVIGTAGHIDHGKTSLVKALTGVDLDTLPEEQARGITISLGFTHLALPDGRRAAFVDVPGHEKLVRTMISGATGIDAVLLCISAVDGAMPQTREHVAILDLLGVKHGILVLTMADLVDEELLALAAEDARAVVAGTFLEDVPLVAFSAVTGQGKAELIEKITALPSTGRPDSGPFRMPVDRVFVRSGFGVVVTGTSWSGTLEDGAMVSLLPDNISARVRGIEVHGEKVEVAHAGRRTAVNLAGLDTEQVGRGQVVVRGEVALTQVLDVQYRAVPGAESLEDGTAVRVLHGTMDVGGRLYLAEPGELIEPGAPVWVQLRLETALPCLPGDPLIVRRPSPSVTLGGGRIVDPWARKVRQRDRESQAEGLQRLLAGDATVWLERAGEVGLTLAECAARGLDPGLGVVLGDRVLAAPSVATLRELLHEALAAWHRDNPLARGAPRRDLRRGRLAHLSDRSFDALLDQLVQSGAASLDGPLIHVAGWKVQLDPAQQKLRDAMLASLAEAGFEGRSDKELAALGPHAIPIVHLLESTGAVSSVAGMGWVRTEVLTTLETQVRGWFASNDELTPQTFKDLTGLTRKAAIPLLEWLDKQKITRREGDRRVRGPALV